MPDIDFETGMHFLSSFNDLISEIKMISKEEIQKGEEKANWYLNNRSIDIRKLPIFSIYVIISKLKENEQIEFIRENIEYISQNDEDIFLYNMGNPCSLVNYLSLNVLKEIKKLDSRIAKKVICGNFGDFFKSFQPADFYDFYDAFSEELMGMKNYAFINMLYYPFRVFYEIKDEEIDFNDKFKKQREFDGEFIKFIIAKYKDKIDDFNGRELLNFVSYIQDDELYVKFILENHDKINEELGLISDNDLNLYLSEMNYSRQKVFVNSFYNNIIYGRDITQRFYFIDPKLILDIYNNDVNAFKNVTLKNWVDMCEVCNAFDKDFTKILDSYEIGEIESLFNDRLKLSSFDKRGVKTLRYLESKFRNGIFVDGNIVDISEDTSIFCNIYLKNIKELKIMFKNGAIDRNNEIYKKHFNNFVKYICSRNIVTIYDDNACIEIEKLFYRIVNGASLTILNEVKNIEDITLVNRVGKKEFLAHYFSVEQLQKYNVKHHRSLCENRDGVWDVENYKMLVLKLMFLVGYDRCKYMLDIDDDATTLEHLVGSVGVKDVKLDKDGNPLMNHKIINLLFKDLHHSRIKEMLDNKESELYKYFPRIFNEWDIIEMSVKDDTLNSIIEFLKSDDIVVPPSYYRLEGIFRYIGCKGDVVKETFSLHDCMLRRDGSTIPNIKGDIGEYSYEVLDVHDVSALAVGNKTDCCFTVLGVGKDCLRHAVTCINGGVLVVKKSGKLVAHSWLWRNGNVLCLDNIEVSKGVKEIDFIEVYEKFAKDVIAESYKFELDKGITNVMLGNSLYDKKIIGINKLACYIQKESFSYNGVSDKLKEVSYNVINLPRPIECVGYSDSKKIQYLLGGVGDFSYYQSEYIYLKNREKVCAFIGDRNKCDLYGMNKKINSLRYTAIDNKKNYRVIDVSDYKCAYCNDDWYVLVDMKGNVEKYCFNKEEALKEMSEVLNKLSKNIVKR